MCFLVYSYMCVQTTINNIVCVWRKHRRLVQTIGERKNNGYLKNKTKKKLDFIYVSSETVFLAPVKSLGTDSVIYRCAFFADFAVNAFDVFFAAQTTRTELNIN